MSFGPAIIAVGVSIDSVDVVRMVEGMTLPGISYVAVIFVDTPAVEEHDGHVDSAFTRRYYSGAQPFEVGRVELRQIKFGFSVESLSRPGSLIRRAWIV